MSERKEAVRATIEAYQSAYTLANDAPAPRVDYVRGWYHVGGKESLLSVKWRGTKMAEATTRLLARARPIQDKP